MFSMVTTALAEPGEIPGGGDYEGSFFVQAVLEHSREIAITEEVHRRVRVTQEAAHLHRLDLKRLLYQTNVAAQRLQISFPFPESTGTHDLPGWHHADPNAPPTQE